MSTLELADETVGLHGHWTLDVYRGDIECDAGKIVNERVKTIEGDNLVTASGKGLLLDRLFSTAGSGAAVTQMGVGTSNTAAAVGDTTLTGLVLQTFDSTPTRSGLSVTCVATYGTATANIVWAELGMFNATPTMLNRIAPIGPFTKSSATSIVVTCVVSQS